MFFDCYSQFREITRYFNTYVLIDVVYRLIQYNIGSIDSQTHCILYNLDYVQVYKATYYKQYMRKSIQTHLFHKQIHF